MALTSQRGLFGPTAADIQAEYNKQFTDMLAGGQSPYERMGMAIGGGLGQLFGGGAERDPRLKRANEITQIFQQSMQGFDPNNPSAAYAKLAENLNAAGYSQEAITASEKAKELAGKQQSVDPTKAAQEVVRQNLIQQYGPTKGNQMFLETLKKAEAAQNPTTRAQDIRLKQLIALHGEEKGAQMFSQEQQAMKVAQAAAQAGGSKTETASAARGQGLIDTALTAATTKDTVKQMAGLIQNAFVGVGANEKLALSRLAGAFGVNIAGVKESEALDMIYKSLTLGQAGNLKGALSDKDLQILKEAVGTRGLTRSSLEFAMRKMMRQAAIDEAYGTAYTNHVKAGNSSSSFDFIAQRKAAERTADDVMSKYDEYNRLLAKKRAAGL